MPAPQRKVEAVKEIAERFKGVDAALLTEYRGLRVGEIAEVRDALRGADADYKVLKNTLARIAVREVGLEDLVGMLEGPTAIAFIRGDAAAAAKALDDAARRFPVLTIKGGVLDGKVIDADQAQQLARLEPREVLLAKVAMLASSPAQQAVNVFAALLRDLGSMLAQVVAHKEEAAPAAPVGEAPEGEPSPEAPAVETERPAEADDATGQTIEPDEAEPGDTQETPEDQPAQASAEAPEEPAEVPEAEDQAAAAPESQAAETQEVSEPAAAGEDESSAAEGGEQKEE